MAQDARTLGQKIRQARLERNMTQKEVVGSYITRNMLSKIENDSATPSVKTLEYLAGVLGLSAGYFMSDAEAGDEITPAAVVSARLAFREKRYGDCLSDLEQVSADSGGYMDEALLLRSRAARGMAEQCLIDGRPVQAALYADQAMADNADSLYGSDMFRTELLLLKARCCLESGGDGFEQAMDDYHNAYRSLGLEEASHLTAAQYWILQGKLDRARQELDELPDLSPAVRPVYLLMQGNLEMLDGHYQLAVSCLQQAEELADQTASLRFTSTVYSLLEQCYKELEDFKMAYFYASRQLQLRETHSDLTRSSE